MRASVEHFQYEVVWESSDLGLTLKSPFGWMQVPESSSNTTVAKRLWRSDDSYIIVSTSDLQVKFWVEGVALSAVAVMGVAGNALSSLVLSRHELRNPFNLLLIGLAFFDTVYIVCSLLYSVHRCFYAASQLQLLLTPLLLFPGLNIAMTGSVLMIVAIAFER